MPDLIQVADDLKTVPDQWLAQQMQSPSGSAPPWLIASEVQRREKLRSGASRAQAPASSVSQDLIKSLYARIPPMAGLGPPTPPGMPPVNLSPGSNPSTLGAGAPAPGATPPGNFKMPPRTMARGGEYDDEEDNGDSTDYSLPVATRRQELERLYTIPSPQAQPQLIAAAAAVPSGPGGGVPSGPAPVIPPPAPVSYPGFQPIPKLPPGSAGKDKFGRDIPVPEPPAPPIAAVTPIMEEQVGLSQGLSKPVPDFFDKENTGKVSDWLEGIYGKAPDTSDLQAEMAYLKEQAQKAKPTLSGLLLQLGTNLMGSKEHNVGVAIGQAGQHALGWMDQQKQQAMRLELARLHTASELAQRTQQFKQKVGSDVVRGTEMLQQRAIADRNTQLRRFNQLEEDKRRMAADWQAKTNAYPAAVEKIQRDAVNKHLTYEEALPLQNSPDPQVAAAAREVVLAHTEGKKTDAQTAADVQINTFKTEQPIREAATKAGEQRREESQKRMVDYRISKGEGAGKPKKLTDPDLDSLAESMIWEQLTQMRLNPPIDAKTGKPMTTPDQLYSVAKDRAFNNLKNPEYYSEDPNFGDWGTREKVLGRIAKRSLTNDQRRGFYAGTGTTPTPKAQQPPTPPPTPPAAPPSVAAPPTAASPQAPIPAGSAGAPPVPPAIQTATRPGRVKMKNGDIWLRDASGQVSYLGRE